MQEIAIMELKHVLRMGTSKISTDVKSARPSNSPLSAIGLEGRRARARTALTPQAAAKRTQRRCHRPPWTCPPCLDLIPHLMLRRRRPLALLTGSPCLDLILDRTPRRRRPLALARPPC